MTGVLRSGTAVLRRAAPALVLVLALVGCAGGTSAPETALADPTSEPTADPAIQTTEALPADPLAITPIAETPEPVLPTVLTGADGVEVTVSDVGRIVPLSGSLAEIVFSLGLGDRVVARDVSADFAAAAHLPVVTHAHDVSAEGVLSLAPTLVLADTATGPPEALEQIRAAGVPLVVLEEAWSLEAVAPRIAAVAGALGVPDLGDALNARVDAQIAAARDLAPEGPPPRVAFLYLRGTAGVYLIGGRGAGADAMLEAVGAVDAGSAAGLERFTPITSEALIAAAPEVLLVMTKGLESVGGEEGLLAMPGIAQTPAAASRRVIALDDGLLLNFGPRTGGALTLLADALYGGSP